MGAYMINYLPLLIQGTQVTLLAWICAALGSLTIGLILGIASCNRLTTLPLKASIRFYTFIAKGIPVYVQILIAYFLIPALLHINVPGIVAACGALIFCSSGYVTEIIRGSLNSVPQGQWDACQVLGYSHRNLLQRIILPQALKIALPSLFGELEQLLKSTSLFAAIGVTELTRTGLNIISRELNPVPVYLTIAAIYLILSAILHFIAIYWEKRLNYGQR
jgi:polar amino acid transport system permease protein